MSIQINKYPSGKTFAFTIVDDTDFATVKKIRPIYHTLHNLGFKTTKTIWMKKAKRSWRWELAQPQSENDYGETLENLVYRDFILDLHQKGFEIALHGITCGDDYRDEVIDGYEEFKQLFGAYPKMNIAHSQAKDNLYWGEDRFNSLLIKKFWQIVVKNRFEGAVKGNPYFWADICQQKTKYVRSWITNEINLLKINPSIPYHDPKKPFINFWFSSSNGATVREFNKLLTEQNLQRLIQQKGLCIIYTHFGVGFVTEENGIYQLNHKTGRILENIAQHKEAWLAPASVILDRLLLMKNIDIVEKENAYILVNTNQQDIKDFSITVPPNIKVYCESIEKISSRQNGDLNYAAFPGKSIILLFKNSFDSPKSILQNQSLKKTEEIRMLFEWAKVKLSQKCDALKNKKTI